MGLANTFLSVFLLGAVSFCLCSELPECMTVNKEYSIGKWVEPEVADCSFEIIRGSGVLSFWSSQKCTRENEPLKIRIPESAPNCQECELYVHFYYNSNQNKEGPLKKFTKGIKICVQGSKNASETDSGASGNTLPSTGDSLTSTNSSNTSSNTPYQDTVKIGVQFEDVSGHVGPTENSTASSSHNASVAEEQKPVSNEPASSNKQETSPLASPNTASNSDGSNTTSAKIEIAAGATPSDSSASSSSAAVPADGENSSASSSAAVEGEKNYISNTVIVGTPDSIFNEQILNILSESLTLNGILRSSTLTTPAHAEASGSSPNTDVTPTAVAPLNEAQPAIATLEVATPTVVAPINSEKPVIATLEGGAAPPIAVAINEAQPAIATLEVATPTVVAPINAAQPVIATLEGGAAPPIAVAINEAQPAIATLDVMAPPIAVAINEAQPAIATLDVMAPPIAVAINEAQPAIATLDVMAPPRIATLDMTTTGDGLAAKTTEVVTAASSDIKESFENYLE